MGMNRSHYSDDCENLGLWRGAVEKAIKGKRGQAFIKELIETLDAMPDKRLVSGELEANGRVCALGSVGVARGIDMSKLSLYDDSDKVARTFGIADAMAREIAHINDDAWSYRNSEDRDADRWRIVRNWAQEQLLPST